MTSTPRVALITGASQGIGEGLVAAYRKLGYAVVATSRTIADSDDPMVLAVPGDIALPGIGRRIVDAAVERFGHIDTVLYLEHAPFVTGETLHVDGGQSAGH